MAVKTHLVDPQLEQPVSRAEVLLRPFRDFTRLQSAAGILLIGAAVAAMIWANSPGQSLYWKIWEHTYLGISLGSSELSMSLLHWINDLVMAVFFLLVGLEIKREILVGELASLKQAALPIVAAIGGMLFPALVYVAFNAGRPTLPGWGVPMATDIAFALGILTLLGPRIPTALKVFLASLAIADDIGALLVIAIFYTDDLAVQYLLAAGGLLIFLAGLNVLGLSQPAVYLLLGLPLWYFVFQSGVHATIAGVLLAATVPARSRVWGDRFLESVRRGLEVFEGAHGAEHHGQITTNEKQLAAIYTMRRASHDVATPLQRLELSLHPWVAFLIVPLFALANAGVPLGAGAADALLQPVTVGIVLGLVIGKPLGIMLMSWSFVRIGVASLPSGVTWRQIFGASCLAGIGFTMSLFIANLAFVEHAVLDAAKLGILIASIISAGVGTVVLWRRGDEGISG